MSNTSEISLSINLQGSLATHGKFVHFHKVNEEGKEIYGIKTEAPTSFCPSKKSVKLGNDFVKGALFEPPQDMRHRISLNRWRGLSEAKRISLHVRHYINATHPEHRGYTFSVI